MMAQAVELMLHPPEEPIERGERHMSNRLREAAFVRAVVALELAVALVVLATTSPVRSAAGAGSSFPFSNQVASTPFESDGYPVPLGSRVPVAGTCGRGLYNANHSESWIAVKPRIEDLVVTSKFFLGNYSTFYVLHVGSYQILKGLPIDNNLIQGYECGSTGIHIDRESSPA